MSHHQRQAPAAPPPNIHNTTRRANALLAQQYEAMSNMERHEVATKNPARFKLMQEAVRAMKQPPPVEYDAALAAEYDRLSNMERHAIAVQNPAQFRAMHQTWLAANR